jgi:hypothetical protein
LIYFEATDDIIVGWNIHPKYSFFDKLRDSSDTIEEEACSKYDMTTTPKENAIYSMSVLGSCVSDSARSYQLIASDGASEGEIGHVTFIDDSECLLGTPE